METFDRRAKIMATLGPASESEETLTQLLDAGLDVVRLNLSHGTHESHGELIRRVREIARAKQRHVPIVLDLMGPRYRLGEIDGKKRLERDSTVRLGRDGEAVDLPVEQKVLDHLRVGERLLINDGLVELKIEQAGEGTATARVVAGGTVSSRKGINLPDSELPFEISDKDAADIRFAVEAGVDYVAASYVGSPEDLRRVRQRVRQAGGDLPIVAKLERGRAVERIDAMVAAADALMVARGDLGVEVPLPRVPVLQKRIVAAGRRAGKPVIVATQMLESMTEQPRPTRAEATDVANAVLDGADALMLSGETAAGRYPVESVSTMHQIIREAEAYQRQSPTAGPALFPLETARAGELGEDVIDPDRPAAPEEFELPDVVSAAAVHASGRIRLRWIVAFSQAGFTARLISRYRPTAPILVFTPEERVAHQVQLLWGVRPLTCPIHAVHHDEVVRQVERELTQRGLVQPGDNIIILMGDPIPERPLTNLLRVHRIP